MTHRVFENKVLCKRRHAHLCIIYGCFSTTMAGLGSFLETTAHKLEHFICGHPQKKFADPQPTQVTNSRYGTERLTEGT